MKEGGHFGEMPEVSEVPDLINFHISWHFQHMPEVLERMPEGMPEVMEGMSEGNARNNAGSNYFGFLPALPTLPAPSSKCPPPRNDHPQNTTKYS